MKQIAVISQGMTDHTWVDETEVDKYIEAGWVLADNYYLKMSAEWLERHRIFRRERLNKYLEKN